MADIFISYAVEDRSRVRTLAGALSDHGWSVWWDRHIPAGKRFDDVITEALDAARCVVVVWSRNSVASSWVREEADVGRKRGVLIPVLFDEVDPPLGFGRIHAAPMIAWDGAPASEAFQKLAADIAAVIDIPPINTATESAAPGAPMRAPEVPAASRPFLYRRSVQVLLAAALVVVVLAIVAYRKSPGDTRDPPIGRTSSVVVSAVLTDGGERLTRGVTYAAYSTELDADGKRKRFTTSAAYADSARFSLRAGRYLVTATYDAATASTEVEVTPAGVTQRTLNLRAGILQLSAVLADRGEPLSGVAYQVDKAEQNIEGRRTRVTGSSHKSETSARFVVPAGRYLVVAAYGNASANVAVEVVAGGVTQQIVNLRAGILELSAVLAQGGDPLERGVRYEIFNAARDPVGNRKRVTGSTENSGSARFVLASGRYFVTAAQSGGNASAEIAIVAGGTRDVQLRLLPAAKR